MNGWPKVSIPTTRGWDPHSWHKLHFCQNQMLQNVFWFFYSEIAQSRQKLDVILGTKVVQFWSYKKMYFTKNVGLNWYSSMIFKKKKDSDIFWCMSRFHDFRCHCAISALQITKKHFATFDFFVKMKFVSSKSCYFQPSRL